MSRTAEVAGIRHPQEVAGEQTAETGVGVQREQRHTNGAYWHECPALMTVTAVACHSGLRASLRGCLPDFLAELMILDV